mmetsp:Transcript_42382/g.105782  ORF Transcript_42382/g.105782 Transcript_42382/m.105782 type:complete len:233 (+) Transcript_42382:2287-2985(+)
MQQRLDGGECVWFGRFGERQERAVRVHVGAATIHRSPVARQQSCECSDLLEHGEDVGLEIRQTCRCIVALESVAAFEDAQVQRTHTSATSHVRGRVREHKIRLQVSQTASHIASEHLPVPPSGLGRLPLHQPVALKQGCIDLRADACDEVLLLLGVGLGLVRVHGRCKAVQQLGAGDTFIVLRPPEVHQSVQCEGDVVVALVVEQREVFGQYGVQGGRQMTRVDATHVTAHA